MHRTILLLIALLIAAATTAAVAPAKAAAAKNPIVGVGEQSDSIFGDPFFKRLGVHHVRYMVPWDTLDFSWQRAEVDEWMAAAEAANVKVLFTFTRSRISYRRGVYPTPARFRRIFQQFRKRYPFVREWITWNEANHHAQPTGDRPKLAAKYYDTISRACPKCTILAASLLDDKSLPKWVRQFRRAAKVRPKIWGLHNYIDANRFRTSGTRAMLKATGRGQVWFTETGGLVWRRGGIPLKESAPHAARATKWVFRLANLSNRIKRVYFYHWAFPENLDRWDSALMDKRGKPRPAYKVLRRYVRAREPALAAHAARAAARTAAAHQRVIAAARPRFIAAVALKRVIAAARPRFIAAASPAFIAAARSRFIAAAPTGFIAAALALVVACGSEAIEGGGVVSGPVVTVYASLPLASPDAGEIVNGARVALRARGGRVGALTVRFKAVDEGEGVRRAAEAARIVIDDRRAVAVIGGLESATTRATAPLFNAAGLLQVALGAGDPDLTRDDFYEPSGRQTFARLTGDDAEAAAAREAAAAERTARTIRVVGGRSEIVARGATRRVAPTLTPAAPPAHGFARPPTPAAALGHAAMTRVLDAIAAAGGRARVRQAVIDAFLRARGPLAVNARGELVAPVFTVG